MTRALTLALACACIMPGLSEPVTLVTGGAPAATIVIPADAGGRLKQAAADLQHYVRYISNVELPLHEDGRTVDGTGLYVGLCGPATEDDLPAADLNPETYAVRVRDGNVIFTGRWPTPTAFAVYSFIEDDLGVRWFAPGGLWEHVPVQPGGELGVDVVERVVVPDTSPRVWSGHGWFDNWRAWNLRNKTVLSEVVPRRQFQNFLYRVFPPSKYAETNPEYYPLVQGERWIPPDDSYRYWRPCESNPDVLRITVEYAREWFDARPNVDGFSLGMDDIAHLCACDDCRAMDPHPDSYERREFSDRHYKFVNAVAREIAQSHPDRYIGTLIYSIARELPETVERLEDNVFGWITETSAAWWIEGRKEADQELSRRWAQRCRHLSRYDYYGFASITPRVTPRSMDEQIKFDKSLGFEGMYTEVYTFLPHTAPMIWALARLQWDHTLDIEELLGEFYEKMYGPAAPIMREYFDLMERSYNEPRPGRGAWEHRNLVNQALAISPEAYHEGMELLQQGINSTGDPDVQARIDIHRAGLRFGGYAVLTYAMSQELLELAVVDEASANYAIEVASRMSELGLERDEFWAEARLRDDLLGETLRGLDTRDYIVTGQVPNLERGGVVGALRALAWYSEHAPDRLGEVVQRLEALAAGPVGEMMKAWMWVQETGPENLLTNPGFDDPGPNVDVAEMDWRTEGAPRGWSMWSRTPETRFEVLGGRGRNGSAAASITDSASSTLLQGQRVTPGERYLCVAWTRADPPDLTAAAKLSIRFRDEQGAWHPRRDLEPIVTAVEGIADWQPLVLLVEIPEGAGTLMVMPGAQRQAEGARALFDHVALYRLPEGE